MSSSIDRAFGGNSALKKRVYDAIETTPQHTKLFEDIANYHLSSHPSQNADEPSAKKRKLPNGTSLSVSSSQHAQTRQVTFEARDISFSIPQRKKLHLGIAQYGTDAHAGDTTFSIFTRIPATNEVDLEVPLSNFGHVLRLPVPEKATKQSNFVLLPKPDCTGTEAMIWTVSDGPAKDGSDPGAAVKDALSNVLRLSNMALTRPSDDEFSSSIREAHRKNDKSYHVKAFRGSKDGYLFFLDNGIFFGFKKPLSFFALEDIDSISYTSVLARTFNLNIAYRLSASGGEEAIIEEVEFSMLDVVDFAGIDAYVKRHGLQDASLAEARRAKKLKNKDKASVMQNGKPQVTSDQVDEDDDRTELEKAQQQLEDEEDEKEEDYDPGSEGESEGSGSESEDEDEYSKEFEKERKTVEGKDIVKEELGSEAEDVSASEDEEGGEEEEQEEVDGEEEQAEEEVEEDDHEMANTKPAVVQHRPQATSIPTHGGKWASVPDPDDDDQL